MKALNADLDARVHHKLDCTTSLSINHTNFSYQSFLFPAQEELKWKYRAGGQEWAGYYFINNFFSHFTKLYLT